jgi:hypothetical protein
LVQKNKKVAIKRYTDGARNEDIEKELLNLEKIDKSCPYVLRCIGFYTWLVAEDPGDPLKIYIVFPLAQGDLDS